MVKWRDIYSIGIDSVDKEHKQLFDILNGLEESIKHIRHEDISCLLNTLIDYSQDHFDNEVKEMTQHNYPEDLLEQHVEEHGKFLLEVYKLEEKSMSLTFGLMMNTSNFLKDWIIGHLLGSDKEFAEFLKNESK